MTANEFNTICQELTISPDIALEDDTIRAMLGDRMSAHEIKEYMDKWHVEIQPMYKPIKG